ncbi:uncharacterized protein ARMOST_02411 [Armillaria ostoyae]|uniref:Uncharacterized protein n=1 Tax=Armillaria ostoyae TaxID=47428 RepID=A0A284QRL2_ARMOS|nr:uncharacterized protein ARMOST_02411 [Armillaria ostoyae]
METRVSTAKTLGAPSPTDRPDVQRSRNPIEFNRPISSSSIIMAAVSHPILSTKSKRYQRDTFVYSTSLPARLLRITD